VAQPLILILGNEWKLWFACDRGDGLEIVGGMLIRETPTLFGLYTIVAVLRELADWIEVCFWKWIMDVFMIRDDDQEGQATE
jgi:hypothetical protein